MAGNFKYADFRAGPERTEPGKPPPPQGHPSAADQSSGGPNGDAPRTANSTSKLSQLLDAILVFLKRYIVFPSEDAAVAVTLWVAHTWTIDAFRFTPYLHISSPVRECGKTRLFACLSHLCMKPWCVISPSEAVLFRKIHADQPTLLLDEIDTVFTGKMDPNKEGIRATLNNGFERGATVPRCHGQSHELKHFTVFGAKAFAGIGNIPETVASRSVKIPMTRRRKEQTIEKFRTRDVEEVARPIVEALKEWSSDKEVIERLRQARPEMPRGLGDRSEDVCEPLFAIADMAVENWPKVAREALVQLRKKGDTDEDETKIQLLLAIREIFQTWKSDHISSKDLLNKLIDREGEPWALWWERDIEDANMKGPASRLARLLKPFGIIPRTIREPDGTTPKGYPLAAFNDAFACYLPPFYSPPPVI
jgi:Protein of unknown function (DUF3631)